MCTSSLRIGTDRPKDLFVVWWQVVFTLFITSLFDVWSQCDHHSGQRIFVKSNDIVEFHIAFKPSVLIENYNSTMRVLVSFSVVSSMNSSTIKRFIDNNGARIRK